MKPRQKIIGLLMKWGYTVQWRILNTKQHGFLPQSRPRFYLVATRYHIEGGPAFTWPPRVAPLGLEELLEAREAVPARRGPMAERVQRVLQAGLCKLKAAGRDPDSEHCAIDLLSSLKWSSAMHERSPCLTASRCRTGGFYLTKFNRTMTVTEICRLQGIPGGRFDYRAAGVSQNAFLFAVGNAMTSTLLARVLASVLNHMGILQGDPVTAGVVKFHLVGIPNREG